MLRREIARFHTVVFTAVERPGYVSRRMHVLYVLEGDDSRPSPLLQLIEYFYEKGRTRSLSWQRETARAIGLLIDFLRANGQHFQSASNRPRVLEAFADALFGGTVSLDAGDSSGLWWQPKSVARASTLLNAVTAFSDWLVNRYAASPLNPWVAASWAEQIAFWRRFDRRHAAALLSHTAYRDTVSDRAKLQRSVRMPRKRVVSLTAPSKYFPDERIWDLLFTGFANPRSARSAPFHERYNVRDMLITILMHGGGVRESEPFHMFVPDVHLLRGSPTAQVRLYHPEQGKAPPDFVDPVTGRQISADREEYLKVRWGLQPRNLIEGRFRAGWKDLLLSHPADQFTLVNWFPSYWGEIFLALFRVYITHCRSRHSQHPYLFVSHKDEFSGEPYTIDSFRQSHARAIRRIGLVPAKSLGTTPHGHRHAFGQRLQDSKVSELIIQRAMHHKSPQSQKTYTMPSNATVEAELREAQARLTGVPPAIVDQINHAV